MGKETDTPKTSLDRSLKLLVKTSFVVFIGVVLSKVLGYLYRVIIARYYGPEVYGLFTLATVIVSFFVTIAGLGLSEGFLRYVPIYRSKRRFAEIKTLITKVLKIYILTGILCSILLWAFSESISLNIFHDSGLIWPLKIFSSMILIALVNNVFLTNLKAFEEISAYSFIFNILQNVTRLLAIVLLIFMGFRSGPNPAVWSFVISMVAMLIASYWFFRIKVRPLLSDNHKKLKSKEFFEFFSYSWPIVFYSLIFIIFYWIDTFSLGYHKSSMEVGLYNAAVPIAMLLGMVPEMIMQLFFPMISRYYGQNNPELIEQLSKQVVKWVFVVLLPIFILIFCFPGAALNLLFGSQYLVAENALKILLIGSFISSLFIVSNSLISMIGKSKIILYNILGASICNFVLNFILVPRENILGLNNSNGMVGAALATLVSIILLNTLFLIQTRKYLKFIPARRNMAFIGILSIIPTLLLFYVKSIVPINIISITILVGLFLLFYLGLILIFRLFDENDWMIIKAILRKIFSNLK
ncbi:MAG: flippase [archaeon]